MDHELLNFDHIHGTVDICEDIQRNSHEADENCDQKETQAILSSTCNDDDVCNSHIQETTEIMVDELRQVDKNMINFVVANHDTQQSQHEMNIVRSVGLLLLFVFLVLLILAPDATVVCYTVIAAATNQTKTCLFFVI